jgi:RNA polymerase sigma-70 factor (ECF subfamily)
VDSSETAASITPSDEQKLVEQLRAGDEAAFEQLVRVHGGRLLAVAQRYLRNEDDARDAVQEAFLGAFRSIDRFREGARISTWLHRIVVNAALMKLRSRRRKPEESIDDLLPSFLPDGHQEQPAVRWREMPDAALERGEIQQRVRDAIDQLPDSYRIVLLLRDIEELDTEETAAALEMSANAVKTRLHRARQALRTLLDAQLRERPA